MENSLFFFLAKPFVHHLNGAFLLILFFVLGYLLFCYLYKDKIKDKVVLNSIVVFGVIIFGLYFRLCLARFTVGNYDVDSYQVVVDLIAEEKNVYAYTERYNYSPVWFMVLGGLDKLNDLFFGLSFRVIVRSFLTLIDLAILFVLYKINKLRKVVFLPTAVAFFLNPVSIIITGHHGQFENITVLLILLGIYYHFKGRGSKKGKGGLKLPAFLFLAAGVVKHIVLNQALVYLNNVFKDKKKVVFSFSVFILIFLFTFVPFWPVGSKGIIKNVFLYKSLTGGYGVSYFLQRLNPDLISIYSKIFIFLFFFFALWFKTRDLRQAILVNFLFFFSFASGMSDQYFVLPLALVALSPSLMFLIYTLVVTFYLLQSPAQFVLRQYNFVSSNVVWLVCLLWFILEVRRHNASKS